MKQLTLVRPTAAVLGALLAVAVQAQTAPSRTVPQVAAPVVSDAAPPPAEDRSSHGAIVLEQSPVRAQRNSTAVMGNAAAVAKPADKALKRSSARQSREKDAATLRLQGAGSLEEK